MYQQVRRFHEQAEHQKEAYLRQPCETVLNGADVPQLLECGVAYNHTDDKDGQEA